MSASATTIFDELRSAKALARSWLLEALDTAEVENLRIEEVRHESDTTWEFTFGFTRRVAAPADTPSNAFLQRAAAASAARPPRVFKRVRVDPRAPDRVVITDPPVE
jgi:hypothetical protein